MDDRITDFKQENALGDPAGQELSLEEAFGRLDEILKILQNQDTKLEEAFGAYQEGVNLIRTCSQRIDLVEKKVMVLTEEGEMHEF